jgi:hypothetical protein
MCTLVMLLKDSVEQRVSWCENNPGAQGSVVFSLSLSLHPDYTFQPKHFHTRDMMFMLVLWAAFLRS